MTGGELVPAMAVRIHQALTSEDLTSLLSDEALSEARRLVDAAAPCPDAPFDLDPLIAAGWYYWLRVAARRGERPDRDFDLLSALDDQEVRNDATFAAVLLSVVHRQRPDDVPDDVRRRFEDPTETGAVARIRAMGDAVVGWCIGTLVTREAADRGDAAMTGRGLAWLRAALPALPANDPMRSLVRGTLGAGAMSKYALDGDVASLSEAVDIFGGTLDESGVGDGQLSPELLGSLGAMLPAAMAEGVLPAEQATQLAARVLPSVPADHPGHAALAYVPVLADELAAAASTSADALDALRGGVLAQWHGEDGPLAALERGIALLRRSLGDAATDRTERGIRLKNLGAALFARYRRQAGESAADSADEAVAVLREAALLLPEDHPAYLQVQMLIFSAQMSTASWAVGDTADSASTLFALTSAADVATPDGREGGTRLANSLVSFVAAAMRLANRPDPDARQAAETAAAEVDRLLGSVDDEELPPGLRPLRPMLRPVVRGMLTDLVRQPPAVPAGGLDALRQTVASLPEADPRRGELAGVLAAVTLLDASAAADPRGEREAAQHFDSMLRVLPEQHRLRPMALAGTAQLADLAAVRAGEFAAIRAALAFGEQTMAALPDNHPIAVLLTMRKRLLEWLGDANRNEPGTDRHPPTVDTAAVVGQVLPGLLELHGFVTPTEQGTSPAELEELRAAIAALPPTSRQRAFLEKTLGDMLADIAIRTRAADAEREAETCYDAVLRALPASDQLAVAALVGKSKVALARASRTGDLALLASASELMQQALTTHGRDDATAALLRLVQVGLEGASCMAGPDSRSADVVRDPRLPVTMRMEAAVLHVQDGGVSDASAVDIAEEAVALLRLMGERGQTRAAAELGLAGFDGFVRFAASRALRAGDAERALTLLENGRGVLLGQQLDLRVDLTGLRRRAPALAERFATCAARLEADAASSSTVAGRSELVRAARERLERRRAADDFDRVVTEIRAVPGFERFLAPLTVPELTALPAPRPIVVLNAGGARCDALILGTDGISTVELDHALVQELPRRARSLTRSLRALDLRSTPVRQLAANRELQSVLSWLADEVTEPVLQALGLVRDPTTGTAPTRVWWVPTGPFAVMPLHAAGRDGDRVLDHVVSSYAPTVRALASSHTSGHTSRAARDGTPARLLGVAMRNTPAAPDGPAPGPLPRARTEVEALARVTGMDLDLLCDDNATFQAVTELLPQARWAHFACHARSESDDPSAGRLLLHDHERRPLTVLDVARARLQDAELAFLSACETARVGERLADESIHITSAFQLAGYRHVVGTLWQVDDAVAVEIARDFYTGLAQDAVVDVDRAALALHQAVCSARDRYPDLPHLWAAHIHTGP
ncbi:CHAT domain-containing protein [Streptomyces sp. NPDC001848]|uniref:CHAT domain-containing protein n=1 Tax=Streptomyces sp. NPDC001848 TaxID=3364618 RepID=UPI0036932E8D